MTTMVDSASALMTPDAMTTASATTTTSRPIVHLRRCSLVSGLVGFELDSLTVWWRMATYWIRPAAMPTAASPKPQWKPFQPHSALVPSGPIRAPMLTPM